MTHHRDICDYRNRQRKCYETLSWFNRKLLIWFSKYHSRSLSFCYFYYILQKAIESGSMSSIRSAIKTSFSKVHSVDECCLECFFWILFFGSQTWKNPDGFLNNRIVNHYKRSLLKTNHIQIETIEMIQWGKIKKVGPLIFQCCTFEAKLSLLYQKL